MARNESSGRSGSLRELSGPGDDGRAHAAGGNRGANQRRRGVGSDKNRLGVDAQRNCKGTSLPKVCSYNGISKLKYMRQITLATKRLAYDIYTTDRNYNEHKYMKTEHVFFVYH